MLQTFFFLLGITSLTVAVYLYLATLRPPDAPRSLQAGGCEFKRRDQAGRELVPLEQAVARVKEILTELRADLEQAVIPVEYRE